MTNEEVAKWIKQKRIKPELAAAIFDISLSTLQNGIRGARWSEETLIKITDGIAKYEADHQAQQAS